MGKPRYIDAEKVKVHFLTAYPLLQRERLMNTIDGVPAADVQKVRHGRWIHTTGYDKCSLCGHYELGTTPYCPYCGARMNAEVTQ